MNRKRPPRPAPSILALGLLSAFASHASAQGAHDHSAHHHHHASEKADVGPVEPLADDEHATLFHGDGEHATHDSALNGQLLFERMEWQDADEGNLLHWNVTGWLGTDTNRAWLKSEGERNDGKTDDGEVQLFWGHAVSPWWEMIVGIRHNFLPGPAQSWAGIGLQGTALYDLETEVTLYAGEGGQTALRLAADYDLLITNRLILQLAAEANFYGNNDPQRGIGSGLSDIEAGLRLRYEIRREFAPYIGVSWTRQYGETADLVSLAGDEVEETRLVVGVRWWY